MIAGFTGSRSGMTRRQREELGELLQDNGVTLLVHGDCVGSDEQADAIAKSLGIRRRVRPCTIKDWRAGCDAEERLPPDDPLLRNMEIVHDSVLLIAAPDGPERVRSGTWATIRYARAAFLRVVVLRR